MRNLDPGLSPLLLAVALLVGCGESRTYPIPSAACERSCWYGSLGRLDNIDHEQPSAEALRVVAETCARISTPCCGKDGIGPHVCALDVYEPGEKP